MTSQLAAHYRATTTCEAADCERPRQTSITIPRVALPPVSLCPIHYGLVAKAHRNRDTGRSKWTPEERHEALVAAIETALGLNLRGSNDAAA
jgi:hypothetical protein